MHSIVDSMGEDAPMSGQQSDRAEVTPEEARERFAELTARLIKPGAAQEPNYQDLVAKRVKYMQLAQIGQ
jgi:hypothetical protein